MPSDNYGAPFILTDALPDLVVGLVGIPVAFALQSVVEALADKGNLVSIEALILVTFLVGLYGLYSVILILTFEVGLKEPVLKRDWLKHLGALLLPHAPLAVLFVGGVFAFGMAYNKGLPEFEFLRGFCVFVVLVAYLPAVYYPRIWSFLWECYRPIAALLIAALVPSFASLFWWVLSWRL